MASLPFSKRTDNLSTWLYTVLNGVLQRRDAVIVAKHQDKSHSYT